MTGPPGLPKLPACGNFPARLRSSKWISSDVAVQDAGYATRADAIEDLNWLSSKKWLEEGFRVK